MPAGSTTPRKLTVTVELDVTEGPRLRRGMTQEIMQMVFGFPVAKAAIRCAEETLRLTPQEVTVNVQWGYVWMDSTASVTPEQLEAI